MVTYPQKEKYDINDLIEVIRLLRQPDGCPWDKEQTHASVRMNFIEEVYEVIEAIDKQDTALMREELGDVLMQVVFHTQMEREQGNFTFEDVCDEVCRKLIIRHPHVFSNVQVSDTGEVLNNWEQIKQQTKGQTTYAAEELGDLLFSCTNVARALGVDAEEVLTAATEKFIRRFAKVEQAAQAAQKDMKDCSLEELETYWQQAKED